MPAAEDPEDKPRCPLCDRSEEEGRQTCKFCGRQLNPTEDAIRAKAERGRNAEQTPAPPVQGDGITEYLCPKCGSRLSRQLSDGAVRRSAKSRLLDVNYTTGAYSLATQKLVCPKHGIIKDEDLSESDREKFQKEKTAAAAMGIGCAVVIVIAILVILAIASQ